MNPIAPDTISDLVRQIRAVIPTASFEFDNYGQIVVYTGKFLRDDDQTLYDCPTGEDE